MKKKITTAAVIAAIAVSVLTAGPAMARCNSCPTTTPLPEHRPFPAMIH